MKTLIIFFDKRYQIKQLLHISVIYDDASTLVRDPQFGDIWPRARLHGFLDVISIEANGLAASGRLSLFLCKYYI